jgi:hypothetical protein
MIALCKAVQPYRLSMRLTMTRHSHQKKQKKKELLFMIIIDHQWRRFSATTKNENNDCGLAHH